MTLAERGLYLELLIEQWISPEGVLPAVPQKIAALVGSPPAEFMRHWPKLEPHFPRRQGGKSRANMKLYRERIEALLKAERRRIAGELGGRPKKTQDLTETFRFPEKKPESESESDTDKTYSLSLLGSRSIQPSPPLDFVSFVGVFFDSYPEGHRVSRHALALEIKKIPPAEFGAVLAGLDLWKKCHAWTKERGAFIPAATKFLRERHWQEPPPKGKQTLDEFRQELVKRHTQ